MTITFEDDFATDDFSLWDSTNGAPIVDAVLSLPHVAVFTSVEDGEGDYAVKAVSDSPLHVIAKFALSSLPAEGTNTEILSAWTTTFGTKIFSLLFLKYDGVYYLDLLENGNDHSYEFSMVADTLYTIEVRYVQNASGEYRVWFNGAEVITVTGVDTSALTVAYIELGAQWATAVFTIYADDFKSGDAYLGSTPPSGSTLTYQSIPISVTLTVGSQYLASGQSLELAQGSTVFQVPSQVTV